MIDRINTNYTKVLRKAWSITTIYTLYEKDISMKTVYELGGGISVLHTGKEINVKDYFDGEKMDTVKGALINSLNVERAIDVNIFITDEGNQLLIPIDRCSGYDSPAEVELSMVDGYVHMERIESLDSMYHGLSATKPMKLINDLSKPIKVTYIGSISNLHVVLHGKGSSYRCLYVKGANKILFIKKKTSKIKSGMLTPLSTDSLKLKDDTLFPVTLQYENISYIYTDYVTSRDENLLALRHFNKDQEAFYSGEK